MNKHAPGPWKVRPVWISQKDSPALHFGEYVIQALSVAPLNKSYPDGVAIADANGRLIAAAPELLEALREAEMELTAWDAEIASIGFLPEGHEPRTRKVLKLVRAAIAKAEGEKVPA